MISFQIVCKNNQKLKIPPQRWNTWTVPKHTFVVCSGTVVKTLAEIPSRWFLLQHNTERGAWQSNTNSGAGSEISHNKRDINLWTGPKVSFQFGNNSNILLLQLAGSVVLEKIFLFFYTISFAIHQILVQKCSLLRHVAWSTKSFTSSDAQCSLHACTRMSFDTTFCTDCACISCHPIYTHTIYTHVYIYINLYTWNNRCTNV